MSFQDFGPRETSGSTTFTLTTEEVIKNAFDIIQVGTDGEEVEAEYYSRALDTLNLVMRELQAQGLHITSYRTGTLFLVGGKNQYTVEDSNSTNDFLQTELAIDAVAGQTFIQVDDSTDRAVDDFIGIIQNDNELFWTKITQIDVLDSVVITSVTDNGGFAVFNFTSLTTLPVGATVTLSGFAANPLYNATAVMTVTGVGTFETGVAFGTDETGVVDADDMVSIEDALPLDANENCMVITYTDEIEPVSRVWYITRRDQFLTDVPIDQISRQQYQALPFKEQPGGIPSQAYYFRKNPKGELFIWPPSEDGRIMIQLLYEKRMDDFKSPTDAIDMDRTYLPAVVQRLALRLCDRFGISTDIYQRVAVADEQIMANILSYDDEVTPLEVSIRRESN